jgi:hypothetical protein
MKKKVMPLSDSGITNYGMANDIGTPVISRCIAGTLDFILFREGLLLEISCKKVARDRRG